MKNLILLLILIPCFCIAQDTIKNNTTIKNIFYFKGKTYTISEMLEKINNPAFVYDNSVLLVLDNEQVKRVYIGLKERDAYKTYFDDCVKSADSLNNIILEQDYNLNKLTDDIRDYNSQLKAAYIERDKLKNKTNWWAYAGVGLLSFITGILIAK